MPLKKRTVNNITFAAVSHNKVCIIFTFMCEQSKSVITDRYNIKYMY